MQVFQYMQRRHAPFKSSSSVSFAVSELQLDPLVVVEATEEARGSPATRIHTEYGRCFIKPFSDGQSRPVHRFPRRKKGS